MFYMLSKSESDNELIGIGKIVALIAEARSRALHKVNEELIRLYWNIGEFISESLENATFGDSFVDKLAERIAVAYPGIKGFNRRGLYRMCQFYELYRNDQFVSALLTQIP